MKLGRYEIVRELGKGAMGIVYLAKDPLIGRLVALKTIRAAAHIDDEDTKEFQQRFIREAQAAGILNHPSIVTVHDIGQDESGTTFIAMEYVEGQNLKEILAQGRALTFDQIGDIIAQIAEALDFAHSKGIVHRDVKPANIILLDGGRAKITDFGIAKIASGTANLTSTGQFLGTPNYMAPEQIKGAPVDGRTDIFSLGICLYECLTRRKPFGGDSLTSISYKIVHEPFPPLHEINPQIPEGYEDVVALALAKEPAKRFQRGREFSIAVRSVVRGERPVRPHEPMLEEATIITRAGNHDRVPTVEVPFPDGSASRSNSGPNSRSGAGVAVHPSAIPISRGGSLDMFRKTMDGVRAMPLWRRVVPSAIFFAVISVLAIGLVAGVASIRSKRTSIPEVDLRAEARAARERQLRTQGNELLRQGKLSEAYDKYMELSKLAPDSPQITAVVHKLASIRQQDEISKQQLAQAKEKFNQGVALYNLKQYSPAARAFEESFHLNPSSDATVNYLRLAQEMDQLTKQQRAMQPRMMGGPLPQVPAGTQAPAAMTSRGTLAQFTTVFNSPVTDGYIMVKVGGEVVAHENLFEEKGRGIFRRKTPRQVIVMKQIVPKNADVEVWVVIASLGINEHRTFRQNILPASNHRLQVSFDPEKKRFDYQLN